MEPKQDTGSKNAFFLRKALPQRYAIVFGVLMAIFAVLGYSYDHNDSLVWVTDNPIKALLLFILVGVIASFFAEALFRFLDKVSKKPDDSNSAFSTFETKLRQWPTRRIFLVCCLVLILAWLPWFIQVGPGKTDSDTVSQLLQYFGYENPTNHHPWFDTIIFGAFWNMGIAFGSDMIGLWAYCGVQSLCLVAGIAMLLVYCRRWKVRPLVWLVMLLVFALYPPFPLFAMCMMKDSLNAVFWLPWLVLFADLVLSSGRANFGKRSVAAFVLLAIACCLTKHTCLYIIVPSIAIALVVCKAQRRKLLVAGSLTLAGVFAWTLIALPAMGIVQDSSGEMMSVPAQQVARYVRTYGISDEDEVILERVFQEGGDALAQNYDPRRADATKVRWRSDSTWHDKLAFARLYCRMLVTHPGVFLSATWNNVYDYFYPGRKMEIGIGPAYSESYLAYWLSCSYEWVNEGALAQFLVNSSWVQDRLSNHPPLIYAAFQTLCRTPVISVLFSEALICSWIPLLSFLFFLRGRRGKGLVMCVPYALVLLSLVFGPISLIRYMAPVLFGIGVLVALLFVPEKLLKT